MTPEDLQAARLRIKLRSEYRDRADSIWHAVYRGELEEKGPHLRVRGPNHAAQMADEAVEFYFEALFHRVVYGAPQSERVEKRRGAATRSNGFGSVKARRRAERSA